MADAQFLVTEAILALVDQWCAAGPVVVAVDDLQWADSASLLVLHRLGQVASQLPLLVAATYRTGAGGEQIAPLIRSWQARGCELFTLGPLDEESVSDLTQTVIGAPPAPGLLKLMAAASGNPLYVTELAAALSRDGRLQVTGGLADARQDTPTGTSVPPSLAAGVARRLAVLSRPARELLPVAAILGGSFTMAELSIVTGSEDADTAAREVLAAGGEAGLEARLRWVMVHARINLGDLGSALSAAQRALASGGLTRAEAARFHGLIAQLLHILGRPEPLASAQRACDEGIASGDPHAAAYGLQATAGAKRWDGRFAEAVDLAARAVAYLQRAGPLVDGQLDRT